MRPGGVRCQAMLTLSEVRLSGKHSGPYVQSREVWRRVDERHWAYEAASVTTAWVYSMLHWKYRVYVEPLSIDHVPVWLHEDLTKLCTIYAILCKPWPIYLLMSHRFCIPCLCY